MSVPVAPPPPDMPASFTAVVPGFSGVAVSDHKAPVSNASAVPNAPNSGAAAAVAAPSVPVPQSSAAAAPAKSNELPSFEPALSNIQAIPTKKLLMVVNTFILNSTDFINKFATQAERKLARVAKNVQRLEIVLALLEAKLDSIKYINDGSAPAASGAAAATPNSGAPVAPAAPGAPAAAGAAAGAKEGDKTDNKHKEEEKPAMKLKDDPRFTNFFKLLRLQVPKEQIRQKMAAEGLDASVLDRDPEGPTVPGAPSVALVVVENDNDSGSEEEGGES